MEEYKKIKTVNRLSETTQDSLHLINEFGQLHNLKEEFRVHFVDDQLQKTEEKLLNEIFSTTKEENERKIEDFIDEKQIKMGE